MVYHHGTQLPGRATGRSSGHTETDTATEVARLTRETVGNPLAGWFSIFSPLYDVITAEQPDLLH